MGLYTYPSYAVAEPRTQKAKGLQVLHNYGGNVPDGFLLQNAMDDFPRGYHFARPCPMVPRHGFVESREIKSKGEIKGIFAEMKAAGEPEGEIVMMQKLNYPFSGIILPNQISIAKGTDGVTNGTAQAYTFPLAQPVFAFDADTIERAGIKHTPYVEYLMKDKTPVLVQLRDGPGIQAVADYIPYSIPCVTRVLQPENMPLLEWEQKLQQEVRYGTTKTVVYLPGQSLTSHYAVQAALAGFAVITSFEPKEGMALIKRNKSITNLVLNNKNVLAALYQANHVPTCGSVSLAMSVLHHLVVIQQDIAYQPLVEFGIAEILRAAILAVIGELRHDSTKKKGGKKKERVEVYSASGQAIAQSIRRAHNAPKWFLDRLRFQGSIGGPRWAAIAQEALYLLWCLQGNAETQTTLSCWNRLVTLCHNNCCWLDKFGIRDLTVSSITLAGMSTFHKFMESGGSIHGTTRQE